MKAKGANTAWSQIWKRNTVVAVVVLFVCAAVYLNWNYEQQVQTGKTLGEAAMVGGGGDELLQTDSSGIQPQHTASGYFAAARLNRQQARDSALSLLEDAAAGEGADQVVKDQAGEAIRTMADYTVTEAQIENLVLAKGYTDCVAFIGEDSLSLAVAAPEQGLTETDTARILDVVQQVSSYTAEQVKIIAVEPGV